MDETAIQLDDGYSDDTHRGDGNGSQEDTPSRADDVDNVLKSQVSVYIFAVYIRTMLSYIVLVLQLNRMMVAALIAAFRKTVQQTSR